MSGSAIYIDAGAHSGLPDHHGFRVGAVVAKLLTSDCAYEFHGVGRVRDIQLLYAHGLIVAMGYLLSNQEVSKRHPVDLISGNLAFWQPLVDTWNAELLHPSKVLSTDQRAVWRRLGELDGFFSIRPPRGPRGADEAAELARVKAGRVRYAQQAVELPRSFFGVRVEGAPSEHL